jgi:hypothetical protein
LDYLDPVCEESKEIITSKDVSCADQSDLSFIKTGTS